MVLCFICSPSPHPHQLTWVLRILGGQPAPWAVGPTMSCPAFRVTVNAEHPQTQPSQGLTAVSLIAHVSTVVVKITPPNAVDTVPIATAILVAETGIL